MALSDIDAKDINKEKEEITIGTGQGEVDKRLGGGIPLGSLVLIEGQSNAGKSVLVQQFMWASIENKQRVMLFTSENTVKSLDKQMDSLGLNILDAILLGWIKIFPIKSALLKSANTLDMIVDGIDRYPTHSLIIVDSITSIISCTSVDDVVGYFEVCKSLCDGGKTIINVAHTYAFDEQLLIRISSACDSHLRLRIEEVGEKLVKVLEVSKIRGADKNTGNLVSFDVEPGVGMKVMPIGKASA